MLNLKTYPKQGSQNLVTYHNNKFMKSASKYIIYHAPYFSTSYRYLWSLSDFQMLRKSHNDVLKFKIRMNQSRTENHIFGSRNYDFNKTFRLDNSSSPHKLSWGSSDYINLPVDLELNEVYEFELWTLSTDATYIRVKYKKINDVDWNTSNNTAVCNNMQGMNCVGGSHSAGHSLGGNLWDIKLYNDDVLILDLPCGLGMKDVIETNSTNTYDDETSNFSFTNPYLVYWEDIIIPQA